MAAKTYNAWFQPIVKKSCPCGERHVDCFAWGEYISAKWRTVDHFCQTCFPWRVQVRLEDYARANNCQWAFQARSGYRLPEWLKAAQ